MPDSDIHPSSATPGTRPAGSSSEKAADETIKETIESIVIAFILAFVFRAYVVEAFVIPTGSMAPTLLGAHTPITCDGCGYHFVSDWPPGAMVPHGPESLPRPLKGREEFTYACPMCRYPNPLSAPARPQSGDRILVHKYLYSVSEPRRWDVVVFKNPALPHQNYIKRLIGLPSENLHLYQGNVYVQPVDPATGTPGDWQIARKPERPEVQRAVFQPIYHSQYIPLDGGQTNRGRGYRWSVPWTTPQPADWTLENVRAYEYTGDGPSALRFDFERAIMPIQAGRFAPNFYSYNQLHEVYETEAIEDVRIAATVEPKADSLSVSLSTTARLPGIGAPGEQRRLRATLGPDGRLALDTLHPETAEATPLVDVMTAAPRVGRRTTVEMWYVDQQVSVWIDGDRVLKHDFDAPWQTLIDRPRLPASSTPEIAITVDRPVVLHEVEVDRDLYYQDEGSMGDARGAVRLPDPQPLRLGPDEFFCVGDNGPRSYDGRFWREEELDPWVEAKFLTDRVARGEKPGGVVPREMMMGRAFFVYFPAPYTGGIIPLPNFGDMRFIH